MSQNQHLLSRCAAEGRGSVAILTALLLVLLIGFVALGTEMVLLFSIARHMQSAADAAALAAVKARVNGYSWTYQQDEAAAVTMAHGFANNLSGTTVTVSSPPTLGNYQTAADAIEVAIAQPQPTPLTSIIYQTPFTVRARAVAHLQTYGSCVLALDTSNSGSFSMNGSTVGNFIDCDVAVNSTSTQAASLVGGAVLNAGRLVDAGGYSLSNNSQINANVVTYAPPTADPYTNTAMPTAAASCQNTLADVKTNATAVPGTTYCSITVSSAQLTLPAGTYFIKGGTLTVKAGAALTGSGVTIVLTGSGSNYATVNISSNSTVTLTAPSAGASVGLPGILFFQDRNAPISDSNTLNGGPTQNLIGALYFPRQIVNFGGGSATAAACTEIIARQLKLVGNATLRIDCSGTGVLPIGAGSAVLVE